jgi:hypothetical protein
MKILLKHKDRDTALLEMSDDGNITAVKEALLPEHLPLSCAMENGTVSARRLAQWWDGRGIPASRELLREVMAEIGAAGKNRLLLECNGLSLTDHYWVARENDRRKWKDVNFYENEFDQGIGGLFFNRKRKDGNYGRNTPDVSSDGNLRKRWDIGPDGRRFLVKAGKSPYMQEPANEVIATMVCGRLGIPHVPYSLDWEDGEPVSRCPNMTDKDREFVEAILVYYTREPSYFGSGKYAHYCDCARRLGVDGNVRMMDRMMVLDYLILNHDRHFKNFGILRNSETLNAASAAPVFDSGSSLFHEDRAAAIALPEKAKMRAECFDTLDRQLGLVKDWSWFDGKKLEGLGKECLELLMGVPSVEKERAEKITGALEQRVQAALRLAEQKLPLRETEGPAQISGSFRR